MNVAPAGNAGRLLREAVTQAVQRTANYLLAQQRPNGAWSWPVYSDPRLTAMYLTTLRALERPFGPREVEMERYLCATQALDGTWRGWPDDPDRRKITALCAIALEPSRHAESQRAAARAAAWLEAQAVPQIDGFWLGYFALCGDIAWRDIPFVSPRILSIPYWLHPNILDFGVMRLALVATSIVQAARGYCAPADLVDQAKARPPWRQAWLVAARKEARRATARATHLMRHVDRIWPVDRALDRACAWLEARQEADGSFFSSAQMTLVAVLAFHATDPVRYRARVDAGLESLRKWQHRDGAQTCQSFTGSTIWDTALAGHFLAQLNRPDDQGAIARARRYLWSRQITQVGDNTRRTKWPQVGGWAFQDIGRHFPDVDDTTVTLRFLLGQPSLSPVQQRGAEQGILWLLSMQGKDGGWASWDRDDRGWQRVLQGGEWFFQDTACPVLTFRAAALLQQVATHPPAGLAELAGRCAQASRAGFAFCRASEVGGRWLCRWFTHYIYGTCYGVRASLDHKKLVSDALGWFTRIAQSDGGFGESPNALREGRYVPARSSAFHTACVLRAFVKAGEHAHPTAQRALRWLLGAQQADGAWRDRDAFASGVPGVWYVNFSGTPTYYAAMALHDYAHATAKIG